MTGRDELAGVVRTDPDHLDHQAAALADHLDPGRVTTGAPVVDANTARRGPAPPDVRAMAETAAALATLRSYITTDAPPAVAAALATLDHATSGLLTVAAVRARLDISDDFARDLIATGRLPSVRLGKMIRVPASALSRLALDATPAGARSAA